MPKSRRLIMLPLALLAMGAGAQARTPKVGEVAPNFELSLVNGQKVTLADLRGEVVVINFWATWCVPCRAELPALDAYYKLQKSHGLRVFAITTEGSVPEKKLHDLFSAMTIEPIHKLKGPYAYIDHAVPTNFVIDRAGKIRYAKAGAFNLDRLNEILIPLLKEPPPKEPQVALAN
uniref:TlpA family protein disulfide reductase n=1 Tax=Altererythrobacter segetis TaxID=1104773 RepID=UPI0014091464